MTRPKLKAEERFDDLLQKIHNHESLDLWSFREVVAEYGQTNTYMAKTVVALAHLAKGDIQSGLSILEEGLPKGDATFARLYCNMLERFSQLEKLDYHIYQLADKHPGKWFNYKAGGIAYLTGRLSFCGEYLDRHMKMLSLEEGRAEVEQFRLEAINDMASAYEISGCTAEQYREIGFAVSRVQAQYRATEFNASITGASGGSYIIELIGIEAEQVALMNMKLADEICAIDLLDDCKLIARFSVERLSSKGVKYAYK